MPVFEYQCKDCSGKYEVFHKSVSSGEEVACPSCSSTESKKLFSTFSASMNGTSSSIPDSSCATGNCGVPAPAAGGCASGMCGI